MNKKEKRYRLGLMVALVSVVAMVGVYHLIPSDASDGEDQIIYGSSVLPYGGVVVQWDDLTDGASYYVIQHGDIQISFAGHDATGVEVMLAGSGLNTNFYTSMISGELEKTSTFTIDGKTVTLVMVPGIGHDLPIYGGNFTTTLSPNTITGYVGTALSASLTMGSTAGKGYSNQTLDCPVGGLTITVTKGSSTISVSGTPTSTYNGDITLEWLAQGSIAQNFSATLHITILSPYTVTLNANGGSVSPSSFSVNPGSSITLPSATKTDYNFLGWYTAASGGTYEGTTNDTYTPSRNMILYAHWEQKSSPVTSISIEGSDSVKKGESTTLTAICDPESASNRHVNWTISSGSSYVSMGSTTDTESGGTVTIEGLAVGTATIKATARDGSGVTRTYQITVTEDPVTYSYSLKYNANGGSGAPTTFSDTSTKTTYTTTISTVKPTKSGYTFLGWAVLKGDTVPDYYAGNSITLSPGTTTLYAVWEQMTEYWYLYYDVGSGTGAPSTQSMLVASGTTSASFTISSTEPTRSGYTFLGWAKNSGATTAAYQPRGSITVTSASTTLYAVWTEIVTVNTFILEFNIGTGAIGGPGNINVSDTSATKTTTIPTDRPVRQGYNFMGWGESDGASTVRYNPGDSITLSPGTKTLFAVWTQTSYVLILDTDGGTPSSYTLTGNGSSGGYTFTIPSDYIPTKSGYIFDGWATTRGGSTSVSPGGTYFVESSAYLYAVWTKVVTEITYTLNYDAGLGTGAPSSHTTTVPEGVTATITLKTTQPTRSGYDFMGWSDVYGATVALYQPGATITLKSTSTTLYAVWSMQPVTFTLSYNANATDAINAPGVQTASKASETYTFTISSQMPTRTNYLFLGWSLDRNATVASYAPGSTITVSPGTTYLYGVWALDNKVWTLQFDLNGGTWEFQDIVDTAAGTTHTFSIPSNYIPVREDYEFLGWSTSDGATEPTVYSGGQFITTSLMSKLYAVWKETPKDTFTVVFDLQGGENGPSGSSFLGRDQYTYVIPADVPTLDGNVFRGWTKTPGGTEPQNQPLDTVTLEPGENRFYAVWESVPTLTYELVFDANGGRGAPTLPKETGTGGFTFNIPTNVPTLEGKKFVGWSEVRNGTPVAMPGEQYRVVSEKTTLYAVWIDDTSDTFIVMFYADGGEGAPDMITENGYRTHTITLPDTEPVWTGHTFAGWARTAGGQVEFQPGDDVDFQEPGTIELHAIWYEGLGDPFYLHFEMNGGINGPGDMKGNGFGSCEFIVPMETPTLDNNRFVGWSLEPNGTPTYTPGSKIVCTDMVTVLHAQWETQVVLKTYILYLDANGGVGGTQLEMKSTSGYAAFVIPEITPTKDGYEFRGWSLTPDGPSAFVGGNVYYSKEVESHLYARWVSDGDPEDPASERIVPVITLKVNGNMISYNARESTGINDSASYLWSFGDGSISNNESGTHVYKESGEYKVSLRIICDGQSETVSQVIVIEDGSSDTVRMVVIAIVAVIAVLLIVRYLGMA